MSPTIPGMSDSKKTDASSPTSAGLPTEEFVEYANGVFPKSYPVESPEERGERLRKVRLLEAQRLKERLSAIPFHAERAATWEGDGYWMMLAQSYQGD